MKFTNPLTKQNLYRMMRNQWKWARKRRIIETNVQTTLEDLDIIDANEFVATPQPKFDFSTIVGLAPPLEIRDETHPLFKETPCFMYRDNTVLLEGLNQALVLTNTVQMESESLVKRLQNISNTMKLPNQESLVKRCIKTTCLYDAEQKKLPIRRDPERPAWNFPRDYGITEARKIRMLCSRLIHLCGLACPELSNQRTVLFNVPLSVPLLWQDELVQFQLCSDIFISTNKRLSPIIKPSEVERFHLPDLTVSHPLISMEEENIYELKDIFPVKEGALLGQVHTIMIHFNKHEVRNLYETPVMETQFLARSLLKSFTVGVAQARQSYGVDIKDLPEPIVVQCIQTDGKCFHFSILQLNSTDLFSKNHNVYWSLPPINLYEICSYEQGVPVLEGYNSQVFKNLLAFYISE